MLINDRWKLSVVPPRLLPEGGVAFHPADRETVAERVEHPAYAPFMRVVQARLERAAQLELGDASLSEDQRAGCAKVLAFDHWLHRGHRSRRLALEALGAASRGRWNAWCAAPDEIIDYLLAADLLRAAGAMNVSAQRALRDQRPQHALRHHARARSPRRRTTAHRTDQR